MTPEEQRECLIAYLRDGHTRSQAAKHFGCSVRTIHRRLGTIDDLSQSARHTRERRERGIELLRKGVSDREVALRLGVSRRTAQDWRRDAGIKRFAIKPLPPEVKKRALDLSRAGWLDREVAQAVGVSHYTIRDWRIAAGLRRETTKKKWPDSIRNAAVAYMADGHTAAAAARKYKIPKRTLERWRDQGGVDPINRLMLLGTRGIYFEREAVLRIFEEGGYPIRGGGGVAGLPLSEGQARNLRRVVSGETTHMSERSLDELLCAADLTLSMFHEVPVWLTGLRVCPGGPPEVLPMPDDWMDHDWSKGYEHVMAREVAA